MLQTPHMSETRMQMQSWTARADQPGRTPQMHRGGGERRAAVGKHVWHDFVVESLMSWMHYMKSERERSHQTHIQSACLSFHEHFQCRFKTMPICLLMLKCTFSACSLLRVFFHKFMTLFWLHRCIFSAEYPLPSLHEQFKNSWS